MNLRVLHCALTNSHQFAEAEIKRYLERGHAVTANTWRITPGLRLELADGFSDYPSVRFCHFDALDSDAIVNEFAGDRLGYDALIVPYPIDPFRENSLRCLMDLQGDLERRLRVIAVPNDSISHLSRLKILLDEVGCTILNTDGIHAEAAAEYTILQLGKYVRNLGPFANDMRIGKWQQEESALNHHTLREQSICVLGVSGRDGSAICRLALKLGMRVFAAPSRSASTNRMVGATGVTICEDMRSAISSSYLISVNLRLAAETRGVFDAECFAAIRPGSAIVSAAGCEVFEFDALVRELRQSPKDRSLSHLVVDIPYGGANPGFMNDPRNQLLVQLGVEMTPRIAGYTIESLAAANRQISDRIFEHLCSEPNLIHDPVPEADSISISSKIVEDLLKCIEAAGTLAESMRSNGLACKYSSSNGLITNADDAVAMFIRDNLSEMGYQYAFSGEELGPIESSVNNFHWIIDAIDGTRNFRDCNYGWCVSVALLKNGKTLLGAVYDPVFRSSYVASAGQGSYVYAYEKNSFTRFYTPLEMHADFSFSIGSFRVSGSRQRKQLIDNAIKSLGGRGREWGSVALSICGVARGGLGVFVQSNSKLHDHVAGLLIARESGAYVREHPSADGERTDFVVSHPDLANDIERIVFEMFKEITEA